MSKELHCRELGFDCDGVVVAENEDDVLVQVADHARSVHGMTEEQLSDPDFQASAREKIHNQAS